MKRNLEDLEFHCRMTKAGLESSQKAHDKWGVIEFIGGLIGLAGLMNLLTRASYWEVGIIVFGGIAIVSVLKREKEIAKYKQEYALLLNQIDDIRD